MTYGASETNQDTPFGTVAEVKKDIYEENEKTKTQAGATLCMRSADHTPTNCAGRTLAYPGCAGECYRGGPLGACA